MAQSHPEEKLCELLRKCGYESQRITDLHFLFSKKGRSVVPVSKRDEDDLHVVPAAEVASGLSRLVEMPDEEYFTWCDFIQEAEKEEKVKILKQATAEQAALDGGGGGQLHAKERQTESTTPGEVGGEGTNTKKSSKRRVGKAKAKKQAGTTVTRAKEATAAAKDKDGSCGIIADNKEARATMISDLQARADKVLTLGHERIASGAHRELSQECFSLLRDIILQRITCDENTRGLSFSKNFSTTEGAMSTRKESSTTTPRPTSMASDATSATVSVDNESPINTATPPPATTLQSCSLPGAGSAAASHDAQTSTPTTTAGDTIASASPSPTLLELERDHKDSNSNKTTKASSTASPASGPSLKVLMDIFDIPCTSSSSLGQSSRSIGGAPRPGEVSSAPKQDSEDVEKSVTTTASQQHRTLARAVDLCFLSMVAWLQELTEEFQVTQRKTGQVFSAIKAATARGGAFNYSMRQKCEEDEELQELSVSEKEKMKVRKANKFLADLQDKVDLDIKTTTSSTSMNHRTHGDEKVRLEDCATLFRFLDKLEEELELVVVQLSTAEGGRGSSVLLQRKNYETTRQAIVGLRKHLRTAVCEKCGKMNSSRWEALNKIQEFAQLLANNGYPAVLDPLTQGEAALAISATTSAAAAQHIGTAGANGTTTRRTHGSTGGLEEATRRELDDPKEKNNPFPQRAAGQERRLWREEMKFSELVLEHLDGQEEHQFFGDLGIRSALCRGVFSDLAFNGDRVKAVRNLRKVVPSEHWWTKGIMREKVLLREGETSESRQRRYFDKLTEFVTEYADLEENARERHPMFGPDFWADATFDKKGRDPASLWLDPNHLPFLAQKLFTLSSVVFDLLEIYRTDGIPLEWGFQIFEEDRAAAERGRRHLLDGGGGLSSYLANDFQMLLMQVEELFDIAIGNAPAKEMSASSTTANGTTSSTSATKKKPKDKASKKAAEAAYKQGWQISDVVLSALAAAQAVRLHPLVRRSGRFRHALHSGTPQMLHAKWALQFVRRTNNNGSNDCSSSSAGGAAYDPKWMLHEFSSPRRTWIVLWKLGIGRVATVDLRHDELTRAAASNPRLARQRFSHPPWGIAVFRALARTIVSSAAQVFRDVEEEQLQRNTNLAAAYQKFETNHHAKNKNVYNFADGASERQPLISSSWSADPGLVAVCACARGALRVQEVGKDGEKLSRRKSEDYHKYLKVVRDAFTGNTTFAVMLREGREITKKFLFKWKDCTLIEGCGGDDGAENHQSSKPAEKKIMEEDQHADENRKSRDKENDEYVSPMEWHDEFTLQQNVNANLLLDSYPEETQNLDLVVLLADLFALVDALDGIEEAFQGVKKTVQGLNAWKYFEEFHARK
ncbi:unnamed protein product [Amoebophrya sp. A120]|nr:unnamed protein product [Amoebophrya sp. A120]|eukprot:GSA120T00000669001.1